jgi:transposase
MIDFEGIDLLPEEKELAEAAKADLETFKERRVKERVKRKPVRKSLPEGLPRVEEHLYPDDVKYSSDTLTELEPEITEVMEYEPGRCWVRKIIRHKYVVKSKTEQDYQKSSSIMTMVQEHRR